MGEKRYNYRKRVLSLLLTAVIALSVCMTVTGRPVYAASGTKVVVLDPGHGGREAGACYYGMKEKTLNLKIARYCMAELKKYANVKVIMTRNSDRAVSSAGTSADLLARCRVAKNNNAKIFVCLHNNAYGAGESKATNGARGYCQNYSFYPWVGVQSRKLATLIQKRVSGCGLTNGGVRVRYSDSKSRRDSNGRRGDY